MQLKEVHIHDSITLHYFMIVCMHEHEGALTFLLIWFTFLWLWSMPLIILEYGVGRFTRKSTVESFGKLLGPSYRFMGAFQAAVGLGVG